MTLTSPAVLETLRYLTLDEDPEHLAEALYGPAWVETLRWNGAKWTGRPFPKAVDVARTLAPALQGTIYHDGRSHRDGRATGWWQHDGERWTTSENLALVGAQLVTVLSELQGDALASLRSAERDTPAREERDSDPLASPSPTVRRYRTQLRLCALRWLLLTNLRAFVAHNAISLGGIAEHLRGMPGFSLPTEARDEVFREALATVELVRDYSPGERVAAADLYEAFQEIDFDLPRLEFYRAADRVLTRRRTNAGNVYVLPTATTEE